jgi:uncharacterized pyridoxamine 5'-phosphate oxidase family protein
MQETYKFLRENRTFYAGTVEGDQPHVRAFCAICIYDNKLYIGTNNTKQVWKQILKNPKIEIYSLKKQNEFW